MCKVRAWTCIILFDSYHNPKRLDTSTVSILYTGNPRLREVKLVTPDHTARNYKARLADVS